MPSAEFQKKPARGGPFRLSQNPVAVSPLAGAAPAEEDEIDELPQTYGTQALYLVASNPERLFAYWDIDWSKFEGSEEPTIRICRADGCVIHSATIDRVDIGHDTGVAPDGGTYFAEIGAQRGGTWLGLARSGLVTMPPGEVSTDAVARFVTIPAGLTFQTLEEMMHPFAQTPGEAPVEILARLQNEFVVQGPAFFDGLLPEQRSRLEALFSPSPLVGGADSSSPAPLPAPAEAKLASWREAVLDQLPNSETLAAATARFAGSVTSPG